MRIILIPKHIDAVRVKNVSPRTVHRSQNPLIGPFRYRWPICTIACPSVAPLIVTSYGATSKAQATWRS